MTARARKPPGVVLTSGRLCFEQFPIAGTEGAKAAGSGPAPVNPDRLTNARALSLRAAGLSPLGEANGGRRRGNLSLCARDCFGALRNDSLQPAAVWQPARTRVGCLRSVHNIRQNVGGHLPVQ